jgi:Ca2+-binding RTX toxin-like protein
LLLDISTSSGFRIDASAETDAVLVIEGSVGGTVVLSGALGDSIVGQEGSDTLHGNAGDDTLRGAAGNDSLDGGEGDDHLDGGEGSDTLIGGEGSDTLYGGAGADVAVFAGSASEYRWQKVIVEQGRGYITVAKKGREEVDRVFSIATLQFDDAAEQIKAPGMFLRGTVGNDSMRGSEDDDTLDGGEGEDSLDGGVGDDTYVVDSPGDMVRELAGEGADKVISTVDYWLSGDVENLQIGSGAASGTKGVGNALDNVILANDKGNELRGGEGNDRLNGGKGEDKLTGGDGDDWVDAGDGDDEIVGGDGAGDDTYLGGDGIDTVRYTSAITGITVDLAAGTASGNEIGSDTLSSIENIIGGQAGDTLKGNAAANLIDGYTGDDLLEGGGGDDTLTGGDGNDTLDGGAGQDTASFVGPLKDYTFRWDVASSRLFVTSVAEGADELLNVETLAFSDASYATSVFQAPAAPTLSRVDTLTGAVEDTPYTITWAQLAAAADEADAQGDAIGFRVEAVTSGTLTKGGVAVSPGTTVMREGDALVWTASANSAGTLDAFTIRAIDDALASATAVQVRILAANVNDIPTGAVTVGGIAREGEVLSAGNTLADADGLGPITYIWKAGANTLGSGSSYTLTAAEVGETITVTASFTDGGNTAESVSSAPSGAVLPLPASTGLQGLAYHWKSHALLDQVAVQIIDQSSVAETPAQRFDLRAASFDAAAGQMSVELWANPTAPAESLDFTATGPAGATLSFTSALGADWIALSNTLRPGQLTSGAYLSNLNAKGLAVPTRIGTLQVQVVAGTTDVQVGFSEVRVGDEAVADLGLVLAGKVTDVEGRASFDALGPSFELLASRPMPPAEAPATAAAVNLQDAVAILKMIAGQPVNAPGRALSPYQALAADFDGNGAVSLADALGVLRHAVGAAAAPAPGWVFMDEADAGMPARVTLNPGVVPATLTGVTPVERHVGLVGVLRGDVDGSWEAPAGTPRLGHEYFTALEQRLDTQHPSAGIELSQWGVYPG